MAALLLALAWLAARPALAQSPPPQVDATDAPRLVRSMQEVYVVEGRKKRWISSLQVFRDWGYVWEQIEVIPDEELQRIPRGPDVVAGPVFRDSAGTHWIVLDGRLRRVAGADAFAVLNADSARARELTAADRARFPEGRPVGNPPRPWMAAPIAALVLAAAAVWWWLPRSGWALAGVVLASLALKLHYVGLFPWFPDGPDALAYYRVSQYFTQGGSLLTRNDDLIGITSPLYPMLLTSLFRLVGDQVVGVRLVQALAATALVPLVVVLGTALFGRRAGLAAGLVAAVSPVWYYVAELLQYEVWLALALTLAFWCLVRFSRAPTARRQAAWAGGAGLGLAIAALLQLKVVVLAAAAGCYVAWLAIHRGPLTARHAEQEREDRLPVLAGGGPSAAALPPPPSGSLLAETKGESYRRSPVLAAGARRGYAGLAQGAAFALLLSLPVGAGLGAWGLRNYVLHGELIFGSTASGIIMWIGNHPDATGGIMQLPRPDAFWNQVRRYPETSPTRELRAWSDLAWQYIRGQPAGFARLALVKLERLWWTLSPDRVGEYTEGRVQAFLGGCCNADAVAALSKLAQAFTLATLTLGVVAVVWRERLGAGDGRDTGTQGHGDAGTREHGDTETDRETPVSASPPSPAPSPQPPAPDDWALLGAIALFCVIHVLFIAEPRYRVPIVPLVQVLQGAGLALLHDRVFGR